MNALRAKVRADHRQGLVDCLNQLEANDDSKEIIEDVIVALNEDIEVYRSICLEGMGNKA